jgi:hypothetical protein
MYIANKVYSVDWYDVDVYHAREEIVDHLNLNIFFVPREKVSRVSSVGVSQRLSPPSSYKQTNERIQDRSTFKQTISFYFHVRDAKKRSERKWSKNIFKNNYKISSEASAFFVVVDEQSLTLGLVSCILLLSELVNWLLKWASEWPRIHFKYRAVTYDKRDLDISEPTIRKSVFGLTLLL